MSGIGGIGRILTITYSWSKPSNWHYLIPLAFLMITTTASYFLAKITSTQRTIFPGEGNVVVMTSCVVWGQRSVSCFNLRTEAGFWAAETYLIPGNRDTHLCTYTHSHGSSGKVHTLTNTSLTDNSYTQWCQVSAEALIVSPLILDTYYHWRKLWVKFNDVTWLEFSECIEGKERSRWCNCTLLV